MIQTQSQNNEIRQIARVSHFAWHVVRREVGWKVSDNVCYKVRDKVWRKIFR